MSDPTTNSVNMYPERQCDQPELFDINAARSLLDALLTESKLYKTSDDYKQLLDFVVRLRNFAPFNAMLLQIQKPGLSYAASSKDWSERFGRWPKDGARPLLILWPFGPVALVYDVVDTDGKSLPADVSSFSARGTIDSAKFSLFSLLCQKKYIDWQWVDAGDKNAGLIKLVQRATSEKQFARYCIHINRNHEPAVQFATLAHELGHLFLGHLGPDKRLDVAARSAMDHAQREIEAESVAYIVCERNGVKSKSHTYLSNFVNAKSTTDLLDIYRVMRAAGQVENLLKLATNTQFDKTNTGTQKNERGKLT